MGYNITLHTPNAAFSLMDESWTLERLFFSSLKPTANLTESRYIEGANWHTSTSVSFRWGCHVRPVSQRALPAPVGRAVPEPLNVAPSLSSLPVKETLCGWRLWGLWNSFHNLLVPSRKTRDVVFQPFPRWNTFCGNRHRNGKIGNGQKTSRIYPQKASLEACQRSSVNFFNMPYRNDCTYLSQ